MPMPQTDVYFENPGTVFRRTIWKNIRSLSWLLNETSKKKRFPVLRLKLTQKVASGFNFIKKRI